MDPHNVETGDGAAREEEEQLHVAVAVEGEEAPADGAGKISFLQRARRSLRRSFYSAKNEVFFYRDSTFLPSGEPLVPPGALGSRACGTCGIPGPSCLPEHTKEVIWGLGGVARSDLHGETPANSVPRRPSGVPWEACHGTSSSSSCPGSPYLPARWRATCRRPTAPTTGSTASSLPAWPSSWPRWPSISSASEMWGP